MAELSYAELPDVQQPPSRPKGVTARQWRLAALYPRCKTSVEALIKAGYARATANGVAKRTFDSAGVQLAIKAQTQAKLDRAREIKAFSASRVLAEVKKDDGDPNYALSAWATASKVAAEYPDEDEGIGESDREAVRAYVCRAIQAVLDATGLGDQVTLTAELVDNALLTAAASDNGQYVNSASPPTTKLLSR